MVGLYETMLEELCTANNIQTQNYCIFSHILAEQKNKSILYMEEVQRM